MDKKRLVALLLALGLLAGLTACGGGGSSSAPGSAGAPEEPDISAMAPIGPEPAPEPEPPYRHPLTGEGSQVDVSGNRPVAVMLNDLEKALPQLGVGQADVIYEIVAEGGITRMMALFQSIGGVGELGSVRSSRDYYVSLAYGHDAIYVHAGGSPKAYEVLRGWGVTAIDLVNGPYEDMCWRDPDRRRHAGLEHSLLTSGDKLVEQMPSRFRQVHEEGFSVGWTFDETAPAGAVQEATEVTLPFSNYKTGYFTYDPELGAYWVAQQVNGNRHDYVDGNTGQQVAVANVLVLFTDVSNVKGDDAGRKSVRTTGSGDGLLFRDGKVYEIGWQRESRSDCYSFLDSQGGPIPLEVGRSYINIVSQKTQVEYS